MNENTEKICPECSNHCSSNQLKCPKGMAYFGLKADTDVMKRHPGHFDGNISDMAVEDAVIMLLHKCGHYLHHHVGHSGEVDNVALLCVLSGEEKEKLKSLLKKCIEYWKK